MYRRYTCASCEYSFSTIEEEANLIAGVRGREATLRINLHRAIDELCGWQGGPWDPYNKERMAIKPDKRSPDDPQS
jgi:hypothetical protein